MYECEIMKKCVEQCNKCLKIEKGIEVYTLYDDTNFICLHCLIDFLTSNSQILIVELD